LARLTLLLGFVELLEFLVVSFIGEELERMHIVRHEFIFSVSLVDESSGSTVLDFLGWGFRSERDSEKFSESENESFLLK